MFAPIIFQAAGAAAGATGAQPQPSMIMQFLPFVGILAVFYFLIIRPQQQRQKKHTEMLEAMKKGDTIVTQGGIIGKIDKMGDDELTIDAGQGVKLRVLRSMIVDVRGKGEPVPANDTKAG